MAWKCYQITFKINSPLHIGYHKVMHLYRTRYYVYGKLLWGAMTAKIAPLLDNDYQAVGEFLKEAIRFGYFYLSDSKEIYLPRYTEEGLKFGNLYLYDFEKKFISSISSTAIEPHSLTAEEGMLYEVEFINPLIINNITSAKLIGFIWLREFNKEGMQLKSDSDSFLFEFNNKSIGLKKVLERLQIGGERRCGFGLIECEDFKEVKNNNMSFPGAWEEDKKDEVIIKLSEGDYIWAHTLYSTNLKIKGDIEPLVGREWDKDQKGAGRRLIGSGLYWCPGSKVLQETKFKAGMYGTWEKFC